MNRCCEMMYPEFAVAWKLGLFVRLRINVERDGKNLDRVGFKEVVGLGDKEEESSKYY